MEIKRSSRKTFSIEITKDCRIIIRAPYHLPLSEIEKLVEEKSDWIEKHIKQIKENQYRNRSESSQKSSIQKLTPEQIKILKEQALQVISERADYFAKRLQVTYKRITIRSQKTRWGSCSSEGNLNFNCLLMLAPPEVLDYVVVHELCHRREMNHSDCFWKEVEHILPDYKIQKEWLKQNGLELIKKIYS